MDQIPSRFKSIWSHAVTVGHESLSNKDLHYLYNVSSHLRSGTTSVEEANAKGCIIDLDYYNEYREKWARDREELIGNDKAVEEGEFQCNNSQCRSKRCYVWTEQNRSSDESETVHIVMAYPIRCFTCSKVMLWVTYHHLRETESEYASLGTMKIDRECCRRMYLSDCSYNSIAPMYTFTPEELKIPRVKNRISTSI